MRKLTSTVREKNYVKLNFLGRSGQSKGFGVCAIQDAFSVNEHWLRFLWIAKQSILVFMFAILAVLCHQPTIGECSSVAYFFLFFSFSFLFFESTSFSQIFLILHFF